MAKNLNQLVVVARPGEPKALDLESLADRSMELALLALTAMLAVAVLASLVHAVHLAWSVCLAGLPVALAVAAFAPRIGIAAAGAFVLAAHHPAFGTVARVRGAAPGLRPRTRWYRGAVAAGFRRGWRRGLR